MNIPDSFFQFMNGLKFLDLTRTDIERVPNCISYLENLTTLTLSLCKDLVFIPSLAKLAKLTHLDLRYCARLNNLPQGMEKLINLECLILKGSDRWVVSFGELITQLSNIQCLELSCGVKDTEISDMQKLGYLERLTGFHIHDTCNFNRYLKTQHFHQLTSYQLILGDGGCLCSRLCFYERSIIIDCLKLDGGAGTEPAQLPDNIQELQVLSCNFQVRNLDDALPSLTGLTRLVRIDIILCEGIESMWSESSCAKPAFENLEELLLVDLPNFRALAEGRVELPPGSFSNLKILKVEFCLAMEKLFTPCLLKGQLEKLEVIEIQVCSGLREIFAGSELDADANEECGEVNPLIVELPKLRVLSLTFLPTLVSICKAGLFSCKNIEEITVINCPELKNLPLALQVLGNGVPSAPSCLQKIMVKRDWWESLTWDNPLIKHTLQPFVEFCK